MADYCVYWIRRTHDHLRPCTPEDPFTGRAGLVGTQNIRNNQSRVGGLDHVVANGGVIVEAVENQPWSGEANVHVSIVNWVKTGTPPLRGGSVSTPPSSSPPTTHSKPTDSASTPGRRRPEPPRSGGKDGGGHQDPALLIPSPRKLWYKAAPAPAEATPANARKRKTVTTPGKRGKPRADKSYELAYRECAHINSALSDEVRLSGAKPLRCNTEPQTSFQGVKLGYKGFVVPLKQRADWIKRDAKARKVVKPFLIGRDLVTGTGQPTRAVIDFDAWDMLKARVYEAQFQHLEQKVLPAVKATTVKAKRSDMGAARAEHLERWWQFWNVRKDMRAALRRLPRYIACSQVTKRPVFAFISRDICPDATLQVFAFADDYSFGILSAAPHWEWFKANCSKLTERFRYTRKSVWDTFPWPQSPTKKQVLAVAEAGREIRRIRAEVLPTLKGGLRALYRTLELPGRSELKDAHAALDAAVLDAYAFAPAADLLTQLLNLNLTLAAALDRGDPATAPGIPPTYPTPEDLVTGDCIGA